MPPPHHSIFTGRTLFLTPNQQCKSVHNTAVSLQTRRQPCPEFALLQRTTLISQATRNPWNTTQTQLKYLAVQNLPACAQTQFARLINQRTANKQCGYYHHLHFNDRLPRELGLVPHRFSAPRCSGTESLWTSGRGILQAGFPSCHPTNSVKALRGALHALGRVSNMRD